MTTVSIWRGLEASTGNDAGYMSQRIRTPSAHGLYLAVERPTRHRAFFYVAEASTFEGMGKMPTFGGFAVQRKSLEGLGEGLVLTLHEASFAEIFTMLVEDVVACVGTTKDEREGLAVILQRLRLWQECLKKTGERGLSLEAQRGLYGELLTLELLLLRKLKPLRAVDAWTGPDAEEQDFRIQRFALEVKTTLAATHPKVTISAARQLDDKGVDDLILCAHLLNLSPGGESLTERVANVRAAVAGHPAALERLEERLLGAGYIDAHADFYDARYTVFETRYYKVDEGFPRITERDVAAGVGDVRYTVSLAACIPFGLRKDEVEKRIDHGAQ